MLEPGPELNDVTIRSSNDRANVSIAPAAIAGAINGRVMWRNAPQADAPRSRAASSRRGSRLSARARTTIATYEMQNVMWATPIWPSEPFWRKSWPKKISRLMPMMISGVIIGRRISVSAAPLPRNLSRASPSPSNEPRTVAPMIAITATRSVTESASRSWVLANSLGYQSRVNPSQTKLRRETLKLKTIRMTIGANRNTYVTTANAVSHGFRSRLIAHRGFRDAACGGRGRSRPG